MLAVFAAGVACAPGEEPTEGEDAVAPVAVATIAAASALQEPTDYAEQTLFEPVRLDGTGSYDPMDPDRGFGHLEFRWRILSTPQGSQAQLEYDPGDSAVVSATPTFTPDEAGSYHFELSVSNPEVQLTGESAPVELVALPLQDLRIGMYWASPSTDVDLHLLAPDGEYWTAADCYYANPTPDWGEAGDIADDPVLMQDDDDGGDAAHPGHEWIGLWQPPWGTYKVVVTYHSDRHTGQTATPWVESSVDGAELTALLVAPRALEQGEAWVVMEIEWPDMDVHVVDEVTTHEDLGGPPIND